MQTKGTGALFAVVSGLAFLVACGVDAPDAKGRSRPEPSVLLGEDSTNIGADVESGIVVVSASYGAGSCSGVAVGNVTNIVSAECNGQTSCSIFVHNSTLGDPAPGCAKDFSVLWNCGPGTTGKSAHHPAVPWEGYTVSIDCP